MHGILITFTTTTAPADLFGPFTEFAKGLQKIDGLISKAWVQESTEIIGGFYLFRDAAAGDVYLGSAMVADLMANPSFSDFQVRRFDVLDELSAMTGIQAATV